MSAFSFPGVPTCEGTYTKHIGLLYFHILIFVFIGQAHFLEKGFKIDMKAFRIVDNDVAVFHV